MCEGRVCVLCMAVGVLLRVGGGGSKIASFRMWCAVCGVRWSLDTSEASSLCYVCY